jgi:AcrR family transcriptional regulator
VGNKADLIEGAKQSLVKNGWDRSTVRVIAIAAEVNHAAISYHFGSRESLLAEALIELVDELGDEISQNIEDEDEEAQWQSLIESFTTHRVLWRAQMEAIVQAQHLPELRNRLAEAHRHVRDDLGGTLPLALLDGLMLQVLIDPSTLENPAALGKQAKVACAQLRNWKETLSLK